MKWHMKFFLVILFFTIFCVTSNFAQSYYDDYDSNYQTSKQYAQITFQNNSDYSMTLKVIGLYGGLYSSFELLPYSSHTISFGSTSTYKLKIKAVNGKHVSYHDGGKFSVTCTEEKWTVGKISFSLSLNGNGIGPKISEKEFESNN